MLAFSRFRNKLKNIIDNKNDKKMKELVSATTKRAKRVHKYKNRTWRLTRSLIGRWYKRKQVAKFYTVYYGQYVKWHYNQNWIKNAWNYEIRKRRW